MKVLMLSPCVRESLGGVQKSGLIAWEAIVREYGPQSRILCYGMSCASRHTILPGRSEHCGGLAHSVLSAASTFGRAELGLFWHMGLLKLSPLARPRTRVLFLHGIEAWRPLPDSMLRLLDRVDVFLSNSDYTWSRFLEFHPRFQGKTHRTVALGAGEPVTVSRPAATPFALIVGRMDRREDYKGHRELITAWPAVNAAIPDAELRVVGGGDLQEELENLSSRLGVSGKVRFYGKVSDQVRDQLLSECRCLAMPSRGEGFGLVYIEAMQKGRPSLVSLSDAGREVVNPPEAGLAVDPGQTTALAGALIQLLSAGGEWDEWSLRARTRFNQQYTTSAHQRRLLDAIHSIAGNGSANA
jgi:phosphatidylinositol alpha-1,6-mannosyltransferase